MHWFYQILQFLFEKNLSICYTCYFLQICIYICIDLQAESSDSVNIDFVQVTSNSGYIRIPP